LYNQFNSIHHFEEEPMKYEKPVVLNLSRRAQFATGDGIDGCVPGAAAGAWESCGSGGAATWGCTTGGSAGAYTSCMNGGAANANGDCLAGSAVQYYCEVGAGGGADPYGCNMGPSF
jgi:hypothetical protein